MMHVEKVRVTKSFTFDMAHALFGYNGPCKNIHGHTYHLFVTVLGEVDQDPTSPQQGLVMDFSDLKKIVRSEVVNDFDHTLVLNQQAPYATNNVALDQFEKVIRLPFQPSCENLMLFFKNKIKKNLPENISLVNIKLVETPTSFAEWNSFDNLNNN